MRKVACLSPVGFRLEVEEITLRDPVDPAEIKFRVFKGVITMCCIPFCII
jgi:hypothetical protein